MESSDFSHIVGETAAETDEAGGVEEEASCAGLPPGCTCLSSLTFADVSLFSVIPNGCTASSVVLAPAPVRTLDVPS
jgi:hypothetical protein